MSAATPIAQPSSHPTHASAKPRPAPPRYRTLAAFLAVYFFWGSTYLAIHIGIETIPPLLMAGVRNVVAGVIVCAWCWARGAERPTRDHWISALIVGALLLLGGNGATTWAQKYVPSGLASLVIATVPLWMVLIDGFRPGGTRPRSLVLIGVAVGILGIALLVGPGRLVERSSLIGTVTLFAASLSWGFGSLMSRWRPWPRPQLLATGLQMLVGGVMLLLAGTIGGEGRQLRLEAVSLRSILALVYLIVFGSLVAFTAYTWLLQTSSPARASTYAFVNPVVALFLGWALANEQLDARTLGAAVVVLVGVAIIVLSGGVRGGAGLRGRLLRWRQ